MSLVICHFQKHEGPRGFLHPRAFFPSLLRRHLTVPPLTTSYSFGILPSGELPIYRTRSTTVPGWSSHTATRNLVSFETRGIVTLRHIYCKIFFQKISWPATMRHV